LAARQSRSITIAGRQLSWREKGQGVALVLIHGTGGSSQSWAPQIDHFADRFQVIAWDAPGYGGSDPFHDDAPSCADYAAALAALLDIRGVMSAHVVGHSIGAPIAAALSRKRPGLALTMTLLHPIAGYGAADAATRQAGYQARTEGIAEAGMAEFARARAPALLGSAAGPDCAEAVTEIMAGIPERGYRQLVAMMGSADLMADADEIDAPTLVIAGNQDNIAPEASCRAIADAIPASEFRALDGIGHYLSLEDAAQFHRIVGRFLDRHGGAAAFAAY
jgi:pimeloyl-ACP methyl ester carboxylesterase